MTHRSPLSPRQALAVLAVLLAHLLSPEPARAVALNFTYGTFATGGVSNSGVNGMGDALPAPHYTCYGAADTCFYSGTSYKSPSWPSTFVNFGPTTTASGSVSSASGTASASASLLSGDISVHASSTDNPAGAGAGFFTQLIFHGGVPGASVTASIGGSVTHAGSFFANAGLILALGDAPSNGVINGFNGFTNIASCDPNTASCPATTQAWSVSTTVNNILYETPYTLYVFEWVGTSGDGGFSPGSVTMTDPVLFNLPDGVTASFSAPGFQSQSIPEPAGMTVLGFAVAAMAAARRRRRA